MKTTVCVKKHSEIVLKVNKLGGAGTNVDTTTSMTNVIERQYDDFEFLHHTLTTQVCGHNPGANPTSLEFAATAPPL
jgi:hypothetical protein